MNSKNIRFRAWLKKDQKMVDVTSIHFGTKKIMYSYSDGPQNYGSRSCRFEDCILLSWYPKQDGVGNDVFEGDILYKHVDLRHISSNWEEDTYIVVNMEDAVRMYTSRSSGRDVVYYGTMEDVDVSSYMVIGNIFENKDMLTTLGFEVQEIC